MEPTSDKVMKNEVFVGSTNKSTERQDELFSQDQRASDIYRRAIPPTDGRAMERGGVMKGVMRGTAGAAIGIGSSTALDLPLEVVVIMGIAGALLGCAAPKLKQVFLEGTPSEKFNDDTSKLASASSSVPMSFAEALACFGIAEDQAKNESALRNKYESIIAELEGRVQRVPPLFSTNIQETISKYHEAYAVLSKHISDKSSDSPAGGAGGIGDVD